WTQPGVPASAFGFVSTLAPAAARSALSLRDALPIWARRADPPSGRRSSCDPRKEHGVPVAEEAVALRHGLGVGGACAIGPERGRSEEHTSELHSREKLVCRLLLEKKNETLSESFSID